MDRCKKCDAIVRKGERHSCHGQDVPYEDGDFFLSAVVAAATDSAILGDLVGGDSAGAILGDLLDGDLFD